MPTYTFDDLDDLNIPYANRSNFTTIDSSITLPAEVTSLDGFVLTISGLGPLDYMMIGDPARFNAATGIIFTSGVVEGYSGFVGSYSSSMGEPVTFTVTFMPGVPRAVSELILESLMFGTGDSSEVSTRTLTYTLSNGTDTVIGTTTVSVGEVPQPATLADITDKANFTTQALMLQGPQLLDSDVTVTLEQGFDTLGTAITVTGMAEGDTVTLRMQSAGSPFAISQSQPDVFDLYHDGDKIGVYYAGYNNGTETPFAVVFTTQVSAAIIEAVIENLQFTSTADGQSARDLSIAFSDNSLQTEYFAADITVKTVPGFASLRDVAGFVPGAVAPHNKLDSKMSLGDGVSFAGGQMVISGLMDDDKIGLDDISGQGTVTLVDGPNDTFQLFFFSSFIGSGSYVMTQYGRDFVLNIDSGLGSTLLDRVIKSLTFLTTASAEAYPSRALTIAFYDSTGDIGMQDSLTVNLGSLDITGFDAPIALKVGADPVLLGTDLTFGAPVGYDFAGAEIRLSSNSPDDNFTVLSSELIRLDDEGRIFYGYNGGYQIGTLVAGDSGSLLRATITLNADASSFAVDALLEALAVSRDALLTEDSASFTIQVVSANGVDESIAFHGASVEAAELTHLRQTLFYNTDEGPQRIDHDVSLVDGSYVGWTLTISGLDTETDSIGVDANYRGGDYYFVQNGTLWRHVGFIQSDFAVGSITIEGGAVSISVGADSAWTRDTLEHLLESLNFSTIGTTDRMLGLTLSSNRGTYFQDSINVVNGAAVRGLEGLAATVTINPFHDEVNGGPARIDSDVTVPGHLGSLPTKLTVSGLEQGDVVWVGEVNAPDEGQLWVNGGLLYRQMAEGIELLGWANGGNGSDFSVDFFVGVTAEQIEATVEALTFTSTSKVITRELAITLSDTNGPAARGLIDVVLDLTPLIQDLSRVVQFNAATIATDPMIIDSDVTLPTDIGYGSATINIARPSHVQIGVGGDYRVEQVSPYDAQLYRGETVIAYWGVSSQNNYISFSSAATRADVESVMEALTFTSTLTDAAFDLTLTLVRYTPSGGVKVAETVVELRPAIGNQLLTGTELADTLTGDTGNDTILGRDGDDVLSGFGGKDTLLGGTGDDTLFGGDGADELYGQAGDDTVYGGNGSDLLFGRIGNDRLFGGNGADRLRGNEGNDTLYGDSGNDLLYGGEDDDRLWGNSGNDVLDGGDGNDTLLGGEDNDTLWGGLGADSMEGNVGDDALYGGIGADTLNGGTGNDTLYGGVGADRLDGRDGADVFVFGLADVGTGVDVIRNYQQGQDALMLSDDLLVWLGSNEVKATDAISWDAGSAVLSLDLDAVGLTGGKVALVRFVGTAPAEVTIDDFLFG